MSPAEIKAVADEISRQGLSYPWFAFVLAALGAFAGAFIVPYLKKKGEDRASEENFARIRAQLQTTTDDTERIKQLLSGEAWLTQQQWSARAEYYSGLLTHLHTFRLALNDLGDYYMEPGSEHTPDSQQGEHFHALKTTSYEAYRQVKSMLGPASLYLSAGTVVALENLVRKQWQLANFGAVCTADYVDMATELAKQTYETVLLEARQHLRIKDGNR